MVDATDIIILNIIMTDEYYMNGGCYGYNYLEYSYTRMADAIDIITLNIPLHEWRMLWI